MYWGILVVNCCLQKISFPPSIYMEQAKIHIHMESTTYIIYVASNPYPYVLSMCIRKNIVWLEEYNMSQYIYNSRYLLRTPPSNSSVLINFKWAVSDNMKCCKIIESARTECIWSWGLILYSTFLTSSAACSTISWLVKLYFVWQVQVKTTSTQTSFASQQWWNYETS